MAGAGVLALVDDTDRGNSQRISDTATTAEPVTTEPVTTAALVSEAPPAEPAQPAPVPTTAKAPIEQRVDNHEERITDLEETTTTAAPTTTSTTTPTPTTRPGF